MVVDRKGQQGVAWLLARRAHRGKIAGLDAAAPLRPGTVPHPQQGMFEHGQLVLAAERVDQAIGQYRVDRAAHERQRRGDDGPDLLGAQARRQIDPAVDGFGQAMKRHGVTQEVGPHRHHDVDRHVLAGRPQQQLDEAVGFIGVALPVAKNLFELVDHQQQGFAAEPRGLLPIEVGQGQRRGAEQGAQRRFGGSAIGAVRPTRILGERMRKLGQRRVAGFEDADVPSQHRSRRAFRVRRARMQRPAVQRRNQSGANQRRLTGA